MLLALGVQYANGMRRVVLSSVACKALQYKRQDFFFKKKKLIGREMCVLIFSATYFWNISNSKMNSERY